MVVDSDDIQTSCLEVIESFSNSFSAHDLMRIRSVPFPSLPPLCSEEVRKI